VEALVRWARSQTDDCTLENPGSGGVLEKWSKEYFASLTATTTVLNVILRHIRI
jgi:hypothetical protein